LTPPPVEHIVSAASIHAQPRETPPQPEFECGAKGGTLPDAYCLILCVTMGALLGSGPWCVQRRHDDASQ
jgi:hypothetical protein